jgi:formylmethanofuran dehydrogenase subunit E
MSQQSPPSEFELAQREFERMAANLERVPLGTSPSPSAEVRCSFCGRSEAEARAMVKGQRAHICDGCIKEAMRLIESQ